jgi:hypothetical protein
VSPDLEQDVRRVVTDWSDVGHLIDGARKRGWSEQDLEYLSACIGITWAKAYRRGQHEPPK